MPTGKDFEDSRKDFTGAVACCLEPQESRNLPVRRKAAPDGRESSRHQPSRGTYDCASERGTLRSGSSRSLPRVCIPGMSTAPGLGSSLLGFCGGALRVSRVWGSSRREAGAVSALPIGVQTSSTSPLRVCRRSVKTVCRVLLLEKEA